MFSRTSTVAEATCPELPRTERMSTVAVLVGALPVAGALPGAANTARNAVVSILCAQTAAAHNNPAVNRINRSLPLIYGMALAESPGGLPKNVERTHHLVVLVLEDVAVMHVSKAFIRSHSSVLRHVELGNYPHKLGEADVHSIERRVDFIC